MPQCTRRAALILAAASLLSLALRAQSVQHDSTADSLPHRRIQPLPALASAPETGLQYGATVLAVWQPAARLRTRPASLTASALRTARQQVRLKVEGQRWSAGNARRITGSVQWQEFPLQYFGIGDTASRTAETFTPRGTEAMLGVAQRIRGAWYATAGVRHVDQVIALDAAGRLRTAALTGTRGGVLTEWVAGALGDTRDNLFAPHRGTFSQVSYARAVAGTWSDFSYGTFRLDTRHYRTVAPGHVLAMQLQAVAVDGAVPFDQLALVGNSDILRGYARGRYRDRSVAAAQAEYRSPLRHRVGGVLFAGAGVAAPRLADITAHPLLPTYGAGLRLEIDHRQRTGIRADYGRGRDGASGVYIGFNHAF